MIAEKNDLIALISMDDLRTLMAQSEYDMGRIPNMLERAGALSPSFSDSDEFVDPGSVWHLFSSFGYHLGDEFLGLSSRPVPPGSTELMVARAMQEPTLGEALSAFADAINILWPEVHAELKYRLDELHFCMTCKGGSGDARQIFLELACIPFYCTFQWLADTSFPVTRVRTAECRPSRAIHFLAILGCGVQFEGEGVDIVLPKRVAALPTTQAKLARWRAEIYQLFQNVLDERKNGFSTPRLQSYVVNALRSGVQSQHLIAASAGISVATLRRNLALERTSFRELSDHIFKETVTTYISSGEPVEAIADKMGYAGVRSFRRAFQRVFGVNPSTFKKNPFSV